MSDIRSNYRSLAFCYLRRLPSVRETDFLDVGSATSERTHSYSAVDSELTGIVTGRPEGDYFETSEDQDGRRHQRGEIVFDVAVDPQNSGVRIRRRLDQAGLPQTADVYVDGVYAGTWRHACQNEYLRWFDSDFDLPAKLTRGKGVLALKLAVVNGPDSGAFTDFHYRVFCFHD
jgi:D-arabinan exo alpha-(1,3)/(1,5)-arabinofuranosidase (non-reducing end)